MLEVVAGYMALFSRAWRLRGSLGALRALGEHVRVVRRQHTTTPLPVPWTPIEKYDVLVNEGKFRQDEHQRRVMLQLNELHHKLVGHATHTESEHDSTPPQTSFFGRLFGSKQQQPAPTSVPNAPKGMYIYGDVGAGKTMVMDMFYDSVPNIKKRRAHFNEFMLDVHRRIHVWKHSSDPGRVRHDPIPPVARDIAKDAALLCFDEFQVTRPLVFSSFFLN